MSNSTTEPSHRAKNEAEILKLIFEDDVLRCTMYDCWKRFSHLQVCIRISSSNGLSVDLNFDCPPTYPDLPPKITLLQPIGLTQDIISELKALLNKKIKELSGKESIYDICAEAREFLQSKDAPNKSMQEKVLNRQESCPEDSRRARSESVKRDRSDRESINDYEDHIKGPSEIKKEEELKCRRQQLLQKIGSLENSIKVELLSKPGQWVELSKITSFEVTRKPVNNFTYEWFGFDQNKVVLVTEFQFDSPVNRRNKEALVAFEKTLESFVESAKIRPYPTDKFLSQYGFFHIKRAKRNKFSLDFLVGQYISLDSKCLGVSTVLNELKSKKDSILPRLAIHLLCGLRTLHEQRFLHGDIGLSSIWINSDGDFFIADHSVMSEILYLYEQFIQINAVAEKQRQGSVNPPRSKDIQSIGTLLKTFSADFCSPSSDQSTFDDFIFQCSKPDADAQKLLNHEYLNQGFSLMLGSEDDSASSTDHLLGKTGRLVNEYNILGFLGSGGFGSVFLARNKLDGNDYAIKTISLSGISKKQIEKIKNEVAVFSRLSNDHITRYFASWVETVELSPDDEENTSIDSYIPESSLENELPERIRNLNIEEKSGELMSTKTENEADSISSSGPGFFRGGGDGQKRAKVSTVLPNILSRGGSDLSIMFVGEDDHPNEDLSNESVEASTQKPKTASFLCLQMEFCQNRNLRYLIDFHQLYLNSAMIWRLFKEILQGVEFIHSYNLIHRDIKPGNIFLDANWSIKIGDFGLATKLATISTRENTAVKEAGGDKTTFQYSMTKDIGTTFYIPPEAKKTSAKTYDEKFDIYSVGIVLFEMIMKPPNCQSERIACLERLRTEMIMPSDYLTYLPENQHQSADSIVKWCLNENSEERPSASELLESNLLPQIISEEDKFHKTCVQIAQDPKHRFRRLLFNELFNSVLPSSIGILYDKNYCIEQRKRRRMFTLSSSVIEFLSNFFRLNGFAFTPVGCLLPSAENYPFDDDLRSYFGSLSKPYKLIDQNGAILTLSTNIRQALARYISHNGITRLRSFSIDRIYSQATSTSVFSSHPDSRTEICLDIVRPSTSNSSAIEILQFVIGIQKLLRPLSSTRWQILLNHSTLVKAIGMHYSIDDSQQLCSLFNLLYDFSSRPKKTEYGSLAFEFMRNFGTSEKRANELIHLIDLPVRSIHKLKENLRPVINNKSSTVRRLVETAISEMNFVFQELIHNLDPSLELTFLPSFVYQPLIFSGLLFSLRVEVIEKGKKSWVPILSGGQYDIFLQKSRQMNDPSSINTDAYGLNLSVENVAHRLKNASSNVAEKFGLCCNVLIACTSAVCLKSGQELATRLREQASMSVELWSEEVPLNDALFEYCGDRFVYFLVVLVSSDEVIVYLNTFDNKSIGNNGFRLIHNRISLADAIKFISTLNRKEHTEGEVQPERFEAHNVPPTNATLSNVNLAFSISPGFKLTNQLRKKYENHAIAVLQNMVKLFNKNVKINAYITELPVEILTQISNLNRHAGWNKIFVEFEAIANSQSSKYKKDVMLLFDELETFFQQPSTSNQIVFLFCPRHSDTFYRTIM